MRTLRRCILSCLILGGMLGAAIAQTLPTTQPSMLLIVIEDIKIGHGAEHMMTESGWPAAYERAKSPDSYLALASMTGSPQVWFVSPYDSNRAMGDSFKRDDEDPVLSAELSRLSRLDAEHLTGLSFLHAVARPDLSKGAFPDVGQHRFWEISVFRGEPGSGAAFEGAAKAYGAAAGRAAPDTAYRIYEVIAGMPSPTYLIFGSVPSFADFDKTMADDMATFKAMTAEERAAIEKATTAMEKIETQRFRLSPEMSYVPVEVRAQDPEFWKSTN
jgi:hypothetical protein